MSGFTNVVIWQPGETLEQLEERVVNAAVNIADGKKDVAAKALGISLQTVYNHLDRAIKREKDSQIARRAQEIVMADHTKVPDGVIPGRKGAETEKGSFDGNGKFNKAKNG
jgi:hypothetical protein